MVARVVWRNIHVAFGIWRLIEYKGSTWKNLKKNTTFVNQPSAMDQEVIASKSGSKVTIFIYCWWKKSCTSWYGIYPMFTRFYTSQAVQDFSINSMALWEPLKLQRTERWKLRWSNSLFSAAPFFSDRVKQKSHKGQASVTISQKL